MYVLYLQVYPDYNPGPTKPDGTVNFECHCVGHLVASPCGWEFREVGGLKALWVV